MISAPRITRIRRHTGINPHPIIQRSYWSSPLTGSIISLPMLRDPYAVLGVPASATQREIAAAYRRLARQHHPDVSDGELAIMQDINWAYQLLRNPARRLEYDRRESPPDHRKSRDGYAQRSARRSSHARHWSHKPRTVRDQDFGSHSRSYKIFGESVDRAIVGMLVGLVALVVSLMLGVEGSLVGAPLSLAVGTWIASVPNPRLSSQHGAAIGAIIGLFAAANFSVSLSESDSLITTLICCAPFTLVLGGSLGAILGSLAGWIRRAGALRLRA
jgi:hypothetical protein